MVALSLLLRAPFLTVPLITDEGGYAYIAQRWLAGQGDLYRDLWFDRPQGIFLAYGLILHTLGSGVLAIRLGGWFFTALTLLIVWGFARDVQGQRLAKVSSALFAVIAASPAIEGFTANAEVFMALPAAGSAWLLLRASRSGWRCRTVVAAGLLAGMATLLKPSGIVMLPLGLAFAGLVAPASTVPVVRRWAGLITGFSIAVAPSVVHGWLTGWDTYVYAVTYRLYHRSATTVTPQEQLGALMELAIRLWPWLIAFSLPVVARNLKPWLISTRNGEGRPHLPREASGALRLMATHPRATPGTEATALLRLWLLAGFAGIAMGGNWFPHYLIQASAPLAMWLALRLLDLTRHLRVWLARIVMLLIGLALLWPYHVVIATRGNPEAMSSRIFDRLTYPAQDEVAAYLRTCTPPESPVYVAFYQASIYYLADRPAAYRHLYRWELLALPGAAEDLVAMVIAPSRPVYIVDLGQHAPFADQGAAFWRAVADHYHLEATIQGVRLYRADETALQGATPRASCSQGSLPKRSVEAGTFAYQRHRKPTSG